MGAAWVGCDCVLLCARDGSRVKTCTHVPAQLFLVHRRTCLWPHFHPSAGTGEGPYGAQALAAWGRAPTAARLFARPWACCPRPGTGSSVPRVTFSHGGSEGQVLPHPSLHPRVGVGEQGWRPLWSLALELCWNQNGAWQALWESVQASVWRLVHTLPRAAPYGPT